MQSPLAQAQRTTNAMGGVEIDHKRILCSFSIPCDGRIAQFVDRREYGGNFKN